MSHNHQVSFSAQITPAQVSNIAEQGYKTLINNRPDNEEAGQPSSAEIADAAAAAGLNYKEVSFSGGNLTHDQVEAFAEFFNQAQQPILMFCRSGNRSNVLYQTALQMDLLDD